MEDCCHYCIVVYCIIVHLTVLYHTVLYQRTSLHSPAIFSTCTNRPVHLLRTVNTGQYVLSPPTAAFLFLASLLFEFPHMMKTGQYIALLHSPSLFIASAVLGVIVNFLSYHLIQLTSSLSLKVLVMFRNFFVILIGIVMYEERTSSSELFGYFFAIIGFAG